METRPVGLIVDDNKINILFLKATLDAIGLPAETAASGPAAIAQCRTKRFDFVLLDYHMPDMDGAEVLRWMNENLVERPAVIVVTADHSRRAHDLFTTLGCNALLLKPVSVASLAEVLAPFFPAGFGQSRTAG